MSINFVNLFWQFVAMAIWILVAATFCMIGEFLVSRLSDQKQTLLTSYLLWFALGWAGAHRIYNGRVASGLALLAVTVVTILAGLAIGAALYIPLLSVSIPMPPIDVPFFGAIISVPLTVLPVVVFVIADAFLIPGWVRDRPMDIAAEQGQAGRG
jgi:hypothetical protein